MCLNVFCLLFLSGIYGEKKIVWISHFLALERQVRTGKKIGTPLYCQSSIQFF